MRADHPLVALAGNPNTGKTSVFNQLTGLEMKVGNYPGITVERQEGKLDLGGGRAARLLDVPGTYSLSARSAEEQIAIQAIAGLPPHEAPHVVVLVVDATQLSRNLYLALQVIEIGRPVIIALNMLDTLERRGKTIDTRELSHRLGAPVVGVSGLNGTGMEELRAAIRGQLAEPSVAKAASSWKLGEDALAADVADVARHIPEEWCGDDTARREALALWALLSLDDTDELQDVSPDLRLAVERRRAHAKESGRDIESEVIERRYAWIDQQTAGVVQLPEHARRPRSERVDALLLHPFLGFSTFLLLMGLLFQSLFSWSDPLIGTIEETFRLLSGVVTDNVSEGLLRDFITEGLIAGVGSVVVFLPQILLLFLFIGLMEDTGYMARVAFLMDRIMRKIGLHGRAFVPMLSGYACAVPAILATRTMERRRDRMVTMMALPLMSCSARLPVYALLIAALFPPSTVFGVLPVQGLLMVGMYLFSTACALAVAAVFSRTVFKGPSVPLILELPPYRLPRMRSVLRMMWQRCAVFLKQAGSIILVCTIALWVLLSFPQNPELDTNYRGLRFAAAGSLQGAALEAELARLDTEESGEIFRNSYGARFGHAIEPLIAPLGFDWKIGVGLIGSFAAREVFVSTMGIVYGVGDEVDEESATLRERIRDEMNADGKPVYTPLVGLSLMIFFALACQCMSTLAAVYRETGGLRWPLVMFAYMTVLAWVASFVVYQVGRLLGFV